AQQCARLQPAGSTGFYSHTVDLVRRSGAAMVRPSCSPTGGWLMTCKILSAMAVACILTIAVKGAEPESRTAPAAVEDVIIEGIEHIDAGELRSLCKIRKGDPMDTQASERARAAIHSKYLDDGRYFASVELVEGHKPTDARVVIRVV